MSIMVMISSREELNRIYETLSQGGKILMPLQSYDFCPYYVWFQDAYGLNWQLFLNEEQKTLYCFKLCLLFGREQNGLAESAMNFFIDELGALEVARQYYPENTVITAEGTKLVYGEVSYLNQKIVFMDHGAGGDAIFNTAFSLVLLCENQTEIDSYWELLSRVAEAEVCGWCQDDFGISWQIVPKSLEKATFRATREEIKAMQAIYHPMKKLEIEPLATYLRD